LAHILHDLTATSPPVAIVDKDYRRARHIKRNMKLQRQIRDLVTANSHCKYIGGNKPVEAIAAKLGFQPHDLAIADVKIGKRIVTMICVPHRAWDTPYRRTGRLPCVRRRQVDLRPDHADRWRHATKLNPAPRISRGRQ
jgi:hypothetical protein